MEIFLSKQCLSLSGMLSRGHGYFIVQRGKRFFGQRSKHNVPPDGHWRFIVLCAEMAKNRLHITDIKIARKELSDALWEAGRKQVRYVFVPVDDLPDILSAADVLNLKEKFNL